MGQGWEADKEWTDRLMPQVKTLVGANLPLTKHLLTAPDDEDQLRNTDLMVPTLRVGVRLREHEYYEAYSDEFTVRYSRPSGNKCEFTKLGEGLGDYLFYGFANEDRTLVVAWALIDMGVFRTWCMAAGCSGIRENKDGSSDFTTWKYSRFPRELVVAQRGVPKKTPVR